MNMVTVVFLDGVRFKFFPSAANGYWPNDKVSLRASFLRQIALGSTLEVESITRN